MIVESQYKGENKINFGYSKLERLVLFSTALPSSF